MQNVTLQIDGMTCGHCVRAVSTALADVPGVSVERVQVGSATLGVASDDSARAVSAAVQAVSEAGYAARVA